MEEHFIVFYYIIALWVAALLLAFSLHSIPEKFIPRVRKIRNIAAVLLTAFVFHLLWRGYCLESAYQGIVVGMTKSDVIRTMGLPGAGPWEFEIEVNTRSMVEHWHYHFAFTHWQIGFNKDGKVVVARELRGF